MAFKPLVDRPASIADADKARLRAVGERLQQDGHLGVPVLRHQPLDVVLPAPSTRLTGDRQRRVAHVGSGSRLEA
jgi:hypothetical protein